MLHELQQLKTQAQANAITPDVIRLTLPYPVSVNAAYVRTGRGVALSDKASAFKDGAAWAARLQYMGEVFTGDVAMTMHFYRPRKRGDITNFIKLLEDALQGICYVNDCQVAESHQYRRDDKENPRVEVEIRLLQKEDNIG